MPVQIDIDMQENCRKCGFSYIFKGKMYCSLPKYR